MTSKYSLSIIFKSKYYKNKKFMKLIADCAKLYNSSGSVIHFSGNDPYLHCSVDDLHIVTDIMTMFEGYDITLNINSN